jgi:NADPH:quinone reductase-like Zn-dependent oxidoreductase
MKAAIRTGFLGYTFTYIQDHIKPIFDASSKTNKNQVYIKIKSSGINPVDYKLPRLVGGQGIGIDFCGTIEEIGNDVVVDDGDDNNNCELKVGDDVFGTCSGGSLAEYCIADSERIAKVPEGWDSLECAALPVAYMSALQSLRMGKIVPGNDNDNENMNKSVLIIGASGGCGIAGIQLCKAMGVGRIVGICSNDNIDFIKKIGVTEAVSYSNEEDLKSFWKSNEAKFDCVYDAATNSGGGEDYWTLSQSLLKTNDGSGDGGDCVGEYVALNGPVSKWVRFLSGTQKDHQSILLMKSNAADLKLITTLLDKVGKKPIINAMPFTEDGLEDAFKLLKSRRTKGKIVFDLR